MEFIDTLQRVDGFKKLIDRINANQSGTQVYGVSDSQKALLVSGVFRKTHKPLIVITHDSLEAKKIHDDLCFFLSPDKVMLFPEFEVIPYNVAAHSMELTAKRLACIEKIILGEDVIIVAPIKALLTKMIPPEVFKSYIIDITVGNRIDLNEFINKIVVMGFERVDMIEGKGQFSIRGGIIDIFPLTAESPYRIELFDDEIDSIRVFGIEDQRSVSKTEKITVLPAREMIMDESTLYRGKLAISQELSERVKDFERIRKTKEAENLKSKVRSHLEQLEEYKYFEGIELYVSYFYKKLTTLLEYFSDEPVVVVDEPGKLKEAVESYDFENQEIYKDLLQRGEILSSQFNIYYSLEDFFEHLKKYINIQVSLLPKVIQELPVFERISFSIKTMHSFHGKLALLKEGLTEWVRKSYQVVLLSGTESRGHRLAETLQAAGINSFFKQRPLKEIPAGQITITDGSLSKGFEFPDIKLVLVSDWEIFGKPKKKRVLKTKRETSFSITTFADLNVGDYVVHATHGIGKYVGVKKLEVDGNYRDYLELYYAGGDRLYIPIEQMAIIQKYVGSEGKPPKLNKLGGSEWKRVKNRVKSSIREMTQELLLLYAEREASKGFAFSPDTPWQKEFEDLFPYEETPDQLRAIEEVKRDMEKPKPMDRLLCGDVGYGKTEVALRAAFKAVMDGKQVAVLVPTTILAQQHFNTFKERFSPFPVNVEVLSRFKSPKEQKKIIQGIREGNVDIIIGTHRLIQKDIKFKDLGLLVIDEEQRFGVAHKEKLKQMKKNIDVLTMTATPIPRTLYMSLSGARDISIIDTPPEDRYPVQTYVVEKSDALIRDAIMREVARGGQVYYVYNHVETIEKEAARLRELLPGIRIAVAHGQMSERQLEKVMMGFYMGEYDVLLCTIIIENGLDIPNVNTLIVTSADKLGLSQLYQLRGRVGRSNRLAYAYITYDKDKVLSEIAEKRLAAIKEFTEFGSGFKIALRDLEIRGAGNILGAQQHGHMVAVGFELYCRMLEETVAELKGKEKQDTVSAEPVIDLKIDAYISDEYIKPAYKVEFYKRIANSETIAEVNDIEEEMEDRFGDIPEAARNLLVFSRIKIYARETGIASVIQKGENVTLTFEKDKSVARETVLKLINRYSRRLIFAAKTPPYFVFKTKGAKGYELAQRIEKILEDLKSFQMKATIV